MSPRSDIASPQELAGTERKILEAASHAFATRGYHGSSLREIASSVGIQAASLYHYVEKKQTLLFKVIVSALEGRREGVIGEAAGAGTPTDRLGAFVRAHIGFQGNFPDQARVLHDEIRSLDPDNREAADSLLRDYEGLLEAILEDGERSGVFDTEEVTTTVRALIDAWDGVAIWYRPGGPWSLEEVGDMYAQLAIASVSAVPPAASAPVPAPLRPNMHATREEILAAATETFAKKGYYGTTIREIAVSAQVQPSVIYHHFGSKEDLLFAILEISMETALDLVRKAVEVERGPVAELSALIRANVGVDAARPFAAIVSDAELDALSDSHLVMIKAMRREYENLIEGIIERGRAEGIFTVPSTRIAVYAIARMCNGVGQWTDPADLGRVELLAERYVDLILAGLGYAGARSPSIGSDGR